MIYDLRLNNHQYLHCSLNNSLVGIQGFINKNADHSFSGVDGCFGQYFELMLQDVLPPHHLQQHLVQFSVPVTDFVLWVAVADSPLRLPHS